MSVDARLLVSTEYLESSVDVNRTKTKKKFNVFCFFWQTLQKSLANMPNIVACPVNAQSVRIIHIRRGMSSVRLLL